MSKQTKAFTNIALKNQLMDCYKRIRDQKNSKEFRQPVQWKSLGLTNYPEVVKCPMDLDTVRKKINGCYYDSHEQFVSDIQLIWSNAKLYNQPDSYVYK